MTKGAEYQRRLECKKLAIVREFKRDKPCLECGVVLTLVRMHLHHRDPSTKHPNLKRGWPSPWRTLSFSALETELLKVDVLCQPCHREAHTSK